VFYVFSSKGHGPMLPYVKNLNRMTHVWRIPVYLWLNKRRTAQTADADCELNLTTVIPSLMSTPQPLSTWTGNRISCRNSMLTTFSMHSRKR